MKTTFFTAALLLFTATSIFAQPDKRDNYFYGDFSKNFKHKPQNRANDSVRIFSLSPIHSRVTTVDGMALGFGHYENQKIKSQTVNGLNLEASPISLALVTTSINVPFEAIVVGIDGDYIANAAFLEDQTPTYIKIKGLNVSSGGFLGGGEVSGMNIGVLSAMNKMSGVSIGGVQSTKKFDGLCIAALANLAESGKGAQIGISNVSKNHKGIQLGLFNHSKNLKGIQFGLWNTNGKRALPIVNWQFKSSTI
jgi:hypothetical protein